MTCILLVEDDDEIRDTLQAVLSTRGFHVLAARHGLDAIDQVHRYGARPSVILLDLLMPAMNGEEFLAAQGSEPLLAHVPVIVDTAQRWLPEPLPPQVKVVLWKPMRLADLLLAIEQATGRTA
jgi:CheY-like chemotaxis protein